MKQVCQACQKNSHETDSIPRKKPRTIPGPLVKAPKVTQD